MEAKEVRSLMEAYASVYEGYGKKKKGDCVSKSEKGAHNCAKKVCSEQWGEGETIFGQHAVPDENGFVSHYDVQFEHGIVENVSVEELEIITEGVHPEHIEHQEDTISEMGGIMNAVKKVGKAVLGPADQSPEAEAARMGKRRPQTKQEKGVAAGTVNNEDVDLFDIIKGHLIDEGFADTEEAAHSIMASMSEGWKQSIVENSSARSREFEKKLPADQTKARSREFEHGSTRSAGTPSGNLADKSPRVSRDKTGKPMY
jgi:hypothetical protein